MGTFLSVRKLVELDKSIESFKEDMCLFGPNEVVEESLLRAVFISHLKRNGCGECALTYDLKRILPGVRKSNGMFYGVSIKGSTQRLG
jgi:hypothetical protein